MSNPFEFVAPHVMARLAADAKPYTVLVFYKDINYDDPGSKKIIQGDHLSYQFKLRAEGKFLLAMPFTGTTDMRAIGIFASTDLAEVETLVKNDPVVIHRILRYELYPCMGLRGDKLV